MTEPHHAALPARFLTGSTLRHVVVMTGTGSIGLMAIFAVDLANLFYISLLGAAPLAAAVGFAGTVLYVQIALCIGMTIGVAAIVSRRLGAGDEDAARRLCGASLLLMAGIAALAAGVTMVLLDPLLNLLGAVGETKVIAAHYLLIVLPSTPLLALGMCLGALLRAVGDARRAMIVTLYPAFAVAALDPLLIFGCHLGLTGAAIAVICSRSIMVAAGWRGASVARDMIGRPESAMLGRDAAALAEVAGPAILTNLATPIASGYVTHSMAQFGTAAVAGLAITDRIVPVAFGLIFALTGAVGPILGQNLGAGRFDRLRQVLKDSLTVVLVTVLTVWLGLFLAQDLIVRLFSAVGETAALVRLFCDLTAGGFLFLGCLFVGNACFNNLGFPFLSTAFNWGRASLGTIPFVLIGSRWAGAQGVAIGQMAGAVVFGLAAVVAAFIVLGRLERRSPKRLGAAEISQLT